MNKEFADRWVADLRDPNNKQCQSVLHDGVGYCCLGRALVVGGFKLVQIDESSFVIEGSQDPEEGGGEYETLDERTMAALGFSETDGSPSEGKVCIEGRGTFEGLADANDKGATFAEIADWVEKNWERL